MLNHFHMQHNLIPQIFIEQLLWAKYYIRPCGDWGKGHGHYESRVNYWNLHVNKHNPKQTIIYDAKNNLKRSPLLEQLGKSLWKVKISELSFLKVKMGRRELQNEMCTISKAWEWVWQILKVFLQNALGTYPSSVRWQLPTAQYASLLRAFFGHGTWSVNM